VPSGYCSGVNEISLFWDFTQRRSLVYYRRFGTNNQSHLEGPRVQKLFLNYLNYFVSEDVKVKVGLP